MSRSNRDQVLAFRLAGHNLAKRLPPGSLIEAASACGIGNYPPGSASLAFNARVEDLAREEIQGALETEKTLIQVRSMRTAPHFFPTSDAAVFTTALLPDDEGSLRHFILGAGPALDNIGISGTDVVERTASELRSALDGRELTFRQLSVELTERIAGGLSPRQLAAWESASWYGPNSCLGEAVVHFALYVVALQGVVCFAPRKGNEASFVRIDQWLGKNLPSMRLDDARRNLVRRYLRCYGPSTVDDFGEWAGISPPAARRIWTLAEAHLARVDAGGGTAWLHQDDLAEYESPPVAEGVRLLPPHDPYLLQRDREKLMPDRETRERIWKIVGNPGVVLVDGSLAGIWRPQKKGKRLVISIESFTSLRRETRSRIEAEAQLLGPFKDCAAVETLHVS